jgi:cobalt/nickel transport system permease protein
LHELYVSGDSGIHQLDARVKVIFTVAFVVFLNLTPSRAWPAYILFLTAIVSVALIARLGAGLLLRRALIALPFALAAVPLIFTGPAPRVPLHMPGGLTIATSPEGLVRCASIVAKSWISVEAAVVLAATTRVPDLLVALQRLRVPKLLVAVVGLMVRYLFVIVDEVNGMLRARASRSATLTGSRHPGGSVFWRARVTGGMAGSLFLRSLERSDRVYAAMVSRGYNGELPDRQPAALPRKDLALLALGLALLALLWMLGLLTGG